MMKRSLIGVAAMMAMLAISFAADKSVTLKVEHMTCVTCGPIVQGTLEKAQGVKVVQVSAEAGTAVVMFDDARTNIPALIAAITDAGYPSQVAP
jgi:mercuric ion binding protein